MKASLKRRDYHDCFWTKAELGWVIIRSVGVVLLLTYFFYRNIWAVVPLIFVGVVFYRKVRRAHIEKCSRELVLQFKECILSVSAALRAGYAVENAFLESRNDMKLLFGELSLIYQELELIRRGLVINITLEELLRDFAERSHCREIHQFVEVFSIAKRSGGNLSGIIADAAEMIGKRIEVEQEIRTLLSGREMEQRIMKLMPFGILFYIGITQPGYFDSLYNNLQGVAIMTLCLGTYIVAYLLSDGIMQRIKRDLGE